MKQLIILILALMTTINYPAQAAKTSAYDYSTPEKALLSLEQAYINKDIEAAINSKSFYHEAKEMAESRFKKMATENIILQIEEILKLSFRKMIREKGFPEFSTLNCSATHKPLSQTMVLLTEKCIYPDKGHSIQKLKAVKIKGQWKIMTVLK